MKKFEQVDFRVLEDVIFKEVFGRISRKKYSLYLLETLTKKKCSINDLDVWRDMTLEKISFDEKEFQADVVMTYQNVIYNIEPYTFFGKKGLIK